MSMETSGTGSQKLSKAVQSSITILEAQFQNLQGEVRVALEDINNLLAAKGDSRLADLAKTLAEFDKFSHDYFDIFSNRKVPQVNHLQQALDKIQREWFNLWPLVEQSLSPHLTSHLSVADVIANDCFTKDKNQPINSCLTFFEKTNHIARFLYSRSPGVAIPLVNLNEPWLWLGLGHEIGHYQFWNYSQNQSHLKESLEEALVSRLWQELFVQPDGSTQTWEDYEAGLEQISVWHSWCEEIFADIYGVFIFGPAYIYSLMTWLQSRVTFETVLNDDNKHPWPLLRPLIQLEALRRLFGEIPLDDGVMEELENEWRNFCKGVIPHKVKFGYWAKQEVGWSRVEEYEELIPIVVEAVFATIEQMQLIPYSAAIHKQVRDTAQKLSQPGQNVDNIPLPCNRPALALGVAWYAWQEIISVSPNNPQKQLEQVTHWVEVKIGEIQSKNELSSDKKQEDEQPSELSQWVAAILLSLAKNDELKTAITGQFNLKTLTKDNVAKNVAEQLKKDNFLDWLGEVQDQKALAAGKIAGHWLRGEMVEVETEFWWLQSKQKCLTLADRVISHLLEGEFSILVEYVERYNPPLPRPVHYNPGYGPYYPRPVRYPPDYRPHNPPPVRYNPGYDPYNPSPSPGSRRPHPITPGSGQGSGEPQITTTTRPHLIGPGSNQGGYGGDTNQGYDNEINNRW